MSSTFDIVFWTFASLVMLVTAIRPQWTVWVLTYGGRIRPPSKNGIRFMQVAAAFAVFGMVAHLISDFANYATQTVFARHP